MSNMILRSSDYVLSLFNINESNLIQIRNTQSLSIDTDYKTVLTIQVGDGGIVSATMEDTPVTVLAFDLNLITSSPSKELNALYWLALLCGEKSSGKHREQVFGIGKTMYHYPDGKSLTEISDFDRGISGGSVRVDSFVAVRDPTNSKLARVHVMSNAQCSNINFNFPMDGLAAVSVSLETDGLSTYLKNLKGCNIDVRFANITSESTQKVTTDLFSRVIDVWYNWRPIKRWGTVGNNQIDFSNVPGMRVYNGDIIKYLFIPSTGERTWESYRLSESQGNGGTYKSQVQPFILTDTTINRVIYGFYPVGKDEDLESILDDGTNDVIALRSGTVWIDGCYYFTGFTEGSIDSIMVGNGYTIITDASFTETTANFWKGATLTIQDGNGAGETLKVIGYAVGGIFTLEGTFSETPEVLTPFRLNAYKVIGMVGDTGIFVVLNGSGEASIVTDSGAPPDSVKLAIITMSGSGIDTYEDARVLSRTLVERVQNASYSIPLDRVEVKELGYEQLVDRALQKPVNIESSLIVKDVDKNLLETITFISNMIRPSDMSNKIGLQLCLFKEVPRTADTPYEESEMRIVFETTNARCTTDNLTFAIGTSGEVNLTLASDNIRIFNIE